MNGVLDLVTIITPFKVVSVIYLSFVYLFTVYLFICVFIHLFIYLFII